MNDSLVYFGDALKALDDNGKVGGYLVRFSDTKTPRKDLDGEYFGSDTYFGPRDGDGVDTVFHHGLPLPIKSAGVPPQTLEEIYALSEHIFAPVKTSKDAVGIWAETVLNLSDAYEAKVYELVRKKKLGWSSGAVSHLVRKDKDGKLKRWVIGEASLTPTPAEPMNRAITVKSLDEMKLAAITDDAPVRDEEEETAAVLTARHSALAAKLNQHIDDLVDDGRSREQIVRRLAREADVEVDAVKSLLDGTTRPTDARLKAFARVLDVSFDSLKSLSAKDPAVTIKAMFEDAIADKQFSTWQLWDIYAKVVRKLATLAESSMATGIKFDLKAKLAEVNSEYISRLNDVVIAQIADYIESGTEENFYLKSLTNPEGNVLADVAIDLDDHSQLAEAALRGVAKRFRGMHETRVKAGRVLSEKNRTRIGNLVKQMEAVKADLQRLLDESVPMASDTEKRKAVSETLRRQWGARQLGATTNG